MLKKERSKEKVIKKAITLIEIMIVIFLIGLISAVVGFNMRGSLDKGKVFRTEQAKRQIEEILELEMAQHSDATPQAVKEKPEMFLERSGLVKNPKELLTDGWGEKFEIKVKKNGQVKVTSKKLENYERTKDKKSKDKKKEEESIYSS